MDNVNLKTKDNLIIKAVKLVNEDKYEEAFSTVQTILNDSTQSKQLNTNDWQFIGHICLTIGKFDLAKSSYQNANHREGLAFTLIMMKDIDSAKTILNQINSSPASLWCEFLAELFSGSKPVRKWPSFLEIRQFMEFTVYCLLTSGNNEFIQLLLTNIKKLSDINQDAEKLIGYAYFHFGMPDESIKLLKNSLKKYQFDGEIYYKLGQIYYLQNDFYEAFSMLNNAQLLLPDHYATQVLLEKVQSKIPGK